MDKHGFIAHNYCDKHGSNNTFISYDAARKKTSFIHGPTYILLAQCHREAGLREKLTELDVTEFGG